MKTEEITIKDAFAWDRQVIVQTLILKNNSSFILGDVNIARVIADPTTVYYSDAVKLAVTEYIVKKKCVLVNDIKVVMTVKTKDGIEHPYSMSAGRFFTPDSDLDTLQHELAKPTALKLIRFAAKEIPFADVESVSCYVEEVNMDKAGENHA